MTLVLAPAAQAERYPGRKIWTRDECEQLERYGFLEGRYELIDGEIILKMGQNRPHSLTLSRVVFFLMGIFGPDRVLTQTTLEISPPDAPTNRPEPDIFVVSETDTETLLIVEVSDTTLRTDMTVKRTLYARAGTPEYWVIDVRGRRLICHRDRNESEYSAIHAYTEHETIAPLSAPDHEIVIADLLPLTENNSEDTNS